MDRHRLRNGLLNVHEQLRCGPVWREQCDHALSAHSKFWGVVRVGGQGWGVTTVSNSLILGGWVTKVLKNGDKSRGGGGVGDNNILTFRPTVLSLFQKFCDLDYKTL